MGPAMSLHFPTYLLLPISAVEPGVTFNILSTVLLGLFSRAEQSQKKISIEF
jgi:hypothetical protein